MIRLLENAKIYIAGHRGLVGSAILRSPCWLGGGQ